MRASLRNLQLIEAYLSGHLSPTDQDSFKRRLLVDPQLFDQVEQQKYTYQLIRQRGRQQLQQELNQLHAEIFSSKDQRSWQRRVLAFFKK